MLNIQEPPNTTSGFALWELPFRPFFLLAPLFALFDLLMWVSHYAGWWLTENYWGGVSAHSHEMIFGFALTVICGFLLTAAKTWTGYMTLHGRGLAALTLLWVAARIAPWLPLPKLLVASLDLAFLPIVILVLGRVLIAARQKRNYIFLPLLLLFWIGDLMMHGQQLGWWSGGAHRGLYLGIDLVLLMIVLLGGRVIPFFTEKGLGVKFKLDMRRDIIAIGSFVAFAIVQQIEFRGSLLLVMAAIAFVANLWRVSGWYHHRIWSTPLLWILHLSYYWFVLGLLLMALSSYGVVSPLLALHAFTAGTISSMILGMTSRVSLGHTGRLLQPPGVIIVAYVLLQIAAVVRVFVPMLLPSLYSAAVALSGLIWIAAFALFVISYGPMLLKPRVDGMPG